MKKIFTIIAAAACMCICLAQSAFAYDCGELTYGIDMSPSESFVIDKKPKVIFRHKLPENHASAYHVQLLTDGEVTDTISIRPSESLAETTYEFPVYTEGAHTLGVKILKDGDVGAEYEYSKNYINSVLPGYNSRGFATHYGHDTYDAQDTALYKAIGADIYRDGYYWNNCEPSQKGTYVFKNFNIGLDMLCVLSGENKLYLNEEGETKITDKSQIEGFANFALEAAKRLPYKKFEIYNEAGSKYTGAEYAKLALAAAKKIKEYDPNIQIYVGCMVDHDNGAEKRMDFVRNFMTEKLYPYIDAVSFHIYTANAYADTTKFNTQTSEYVETIKSRGGWKELAMTETGWPVGSWANVPAEKQSSELVKRMVLSDDLRLSVVNLYEFKNSNVTDENNYENNLGIVELDKTLRPAYYTLKNYFKNTNKAQYIGRANLGDGIKAYAYAANGDYFLIAWAKNTSDSLNINTNSNSGASYTFSENVSITDMFGNTISGNTLKTDYTPKYVHGLSGSAVLSLIKAYGTGEIVPSALASTGYSSEANEIAVLYNAICDAPSADAVTNYVEYCYDLGDTTAKTSTLSGPELSNLLSEIDKAAECGARLMACSEACPENDFSFGYKLEKTHLESLLTFADRSGTRYISEPYEKGKDIMEKLSRYEDSGLINPINGENFTLDSTGVLKVNAKSNSDFAAVKISKGSEIVYLNTFGKGDVSFEYVLPEKGEYTLEINSGEKQTEMINYADNGYISLEDKMTYIGILRTERLFNWSKLLMSDYIENQKGIKLPEKIDKETVGERTYIVLDYSDSDYDIYAALYGANGELVSIDKAEIGICKADITGITEYKIRAFVWNGMTPRYKADEYTIK